MSPGPPLGDCQLRVPGTSLLPGSEKAPPAVQPMSHGVSAAEDALHEKTAQLRHTRDERIEDLRTSVRKTPLLCVAAAFALGAVIALCKGALALNNPHGSALGPAKPASAP